MAENANLLPVEAQNAIRDCVQNAISQAFLDIELVDLTFYKQYGKLNVELFLWKKSGISLDDCEAVHNIVSSSLDALDDLFPDEYVLNVSSSGLDRKIVSNDDYRRALDTEIECIDNAKNKVHGILISYDEQTVVLKTQGKNTQEKVLQRNLLTKVQPYIRF